MFILNLAVVQVEFSNGSIEFSNGSIWVQY